MTSPRTTLVAAAVLTLCAAASVVNGQPPAKSDLDRMQGAWVCVRTLKDGQEVKTYVGVKAVLQGDNLTWHFPKPDGTFSTQENKFRIDPVRKHFDWWRPNNPDRVEMRLYTLGEDELRWSTHVDWKSRPESFDKGRWQFTMRRVR